MAKKKASKSKAKTTEVVENGLPQNILPIGERVEEDKNIYISQPVYKEIHKFTKNKTTNESGGMLVGEIIEEFGKTNIIIKGFVEAKYCEGTPTTLTFTHETWDYVHKEIDKKFPGQKIVGWIHTHPNFGIFLSEYDKFIQENFFKEEYQIAYVIDPIQSEEGFYFWVNGKIERCKGFYKYDKMGVKLEEATAKQEAEAVKDNSWFSIKNVIIAILVVAVVWLAFANVSQNNEIDKLNDEITETQVLMDEYATYLYSQMYGLEMEIQELISDESQGDQNASNEETTDNNETGGQQ